MAIAKNGGKEEIKANVLKAVLMMSHTVLSVTTASVKNVMLVSTGMKTLWTAYQLVFLVSTEMDTDAKFVQIVVLSVIMKLETACYAMMKLLLGIIKQWLLLMKIVIGLVALTIV